MRLDTGEVERRLETGKLVRDAAFARGEATSPWSPPTTARYPKSMRWRPADCASSRTTTMPMLAELQLGAVEDISFPSRDGTIIHGMMVKPADYRAGRLYPTILWIHGGPNGQDSHGMSGRHLSARARAAMVRGPRLRGPGDKLSRQQRPRRLIRSARSRRIGDTRKWRISSVRSTMPCARRSPTRIGSAWVAGAMAASSPITSSPPTRASRPPSAGAGSGNQLSMYGSDRIHSAVQRGTAAALGRDTARGSRCPIRSFTPIASRHRPCSSGGDKDFNVPIAGGEQMYAALRTLGVPARAHRLSRPISSADPPELHQGPVRSAISPGSTAISERPGAETGGIAGAGCRALRFGPQSRAQAGARQAPDAGGCELAHRTVIHQSAASSGRTARP